MDNRAVDPLRVQLDQTEKTISRLCDLLEKEVALRTTSVEEARRVEEQKRMALTIADQVREDILAEMRNSTPAPLPAVRKRPTTGE